VTGEAGTLVGAEILKEGIVRRDGGNTGLECTDHSTGIGVEFELWNDWRRWLGPIVSVWVTAHLLRVSDCSSRPRCRLTRIYCADVLRPGLLHSSKTTEQSEITEQKP
jgi:hypothetical protein